MVIKSVILDKLMNLVITKFLKTFLANVATSKFLVQKMFT